MIVTRSLTQSAAEAECQKRGGHLAAVESKAENDVVHQLAKSTTVLNLSRERCNLWQYQILKKFFLTYYLVKLELLTFTCRLELIELSSMNIAD